MKKIRLSCFLLIVCAVGSKQISGQIFIEKDSVNYQTVLNKVDSFHHYKNLTNEILKELFTYAGLKYDTIDYYTEDYIEISQGKRLFLFEPRVSDTLLCAVFDSSGIYRINKYYFPRAWRGDELDSRLWTKGKKFMICYINSEENGGPIYSPYEQRIIRRLDFYYDEEKGEIIDTILIPPLPPYPKYRRPGQHR